MWRRLEGGKSVPGGTFDFPIQGDGLMRDHEVRLAAAPGYRDVIIELRLDPVPAGGAGDWVRVETVAFAAK